MLSTARPLLVGILSMTSGSQRFYASEEQASRLAAGRRGESAAVRYLEAKQYGILARNVRLGRDEIDIVAFDPRDCVLVFCEVKTRSRSDADYPALLNLTPKKRNAMARAARAFAADTQWGGGFRCDAVFVEAGKVAAHVEAVETDSSD